MGQDAGGLCREFGCKVPEWKKKSLSRTPLGRWYRRQKLRPRGSHVSYSWRNPQHELLPMLQCHQCTPKRGQNRTGCSDGTHTTEQRVQAPGTPSSPSLLLGRCGARDKSFFPLRCLVLALTRLPRRGHHSPTQEAKEAAPWLSHLRTCLCQGRAVLQSNSCWTKRSHTFPKLQPPIWKVPAKPAHFQPAGVLRIQGFL